MGLFESNKIPEPPRPQQVQEQKSKKPAIVEIEWEDVMSFESALLDQFDLAEIIPATAFITGYLVEETQDYYYIAKEWWDSEQFKYLHLVPKRVVRNIKYV